MQDFQFHEDYMLPFAEFLRRLKPAMASASAAPELVEEDLTPYTVAVDL